CKANGNAQTVCVAAGFHRAGSVTKKLRLDGFCRSCRSPGLWRARMARVPCATRTPARFVQTTTLDSLTIWEGKPRIDLTSRESHHETVVVAKVLVTNPPAHSRRALAVPRKGARFVAALAGSAGRPPHTGQQHHRRARAGRYRLAGRIPDRLRWHRRRQR